MKKIVDEGGVKTKKVFFTKCSNIAFSVMAEWLAGSCK